MTQINQPLPDDEKPSEMLRRLIAVRADDTRKMLLGGETRREKSAKPLSPARIEREFAVIRAALNDAIPSKLLVNVCYVTFCPFLRRGQQHRPVGPVTVKGLPAELAWRQGWWQDRDATAELSL